MKVRELEGDLISTRYWDMYRDRLILVAAAAGPANEVLEAPQELLGGLFAL